MSFDLLRLLLLPFYGFVGWYLARRHGVGPLLQRTASALVLAGLAALGVTGSMHVEGSTAAHLHRWTAHGLVIFAWIAMPLAVGARYGQLRGTLAFVALHFVLLVMLFWTSFTGYLRPHDASGDAGIVGEETHNRFIVLHMFVMPAATAALATVWAWIAWRRGAAQEGDGGKALAS